MQTNIEWLSNNVFKVGIVSDLRDIDEGWSTYLTKYVEKVHYKLFDTQSYPSLILDNTAKEFYNNIIIHKKEVGAKFSSTYFDIIHLNANKTMKINIMGYK